MRRLARVIALAAVAVAAGGCTTVRVAQKDGCWVRETKRTLRGALQDVGPCAKPPPEWSEDRLTRLVQECVAQADYRWHARALAAWSRREPPPPQDAQETVIRTCMNEAATGVVAQNETLRQRLAEVSSDRELFRTDAAQGTQHLRASADRIAEFLGEAAKRPPPVATATATATSDGSALTENGLQSETGATSEMAPAAGSAGSAGVPVVPAAAAPPSPADAKAEPPGAPAPEARPATGSSVRKAETTKAALRRRALAKAARRAGCDVPASAPEKPTQVVCPAPGPANAEAVGSR